MAALAPGIVWFRQDLRLEDHPALMALIRSGRPVIPLYIWAPDEEGDWPSGAASRWWLHQSLKSLAQSLESAGSKLVLRTGPSLQTLETMVQETRAEVVLWNRRYEPQAVQRDQRIQDALRAHGIEAESFNGSLLNEPWTVTNKMGRPYQVFTAYWKACLAKRNGSEPLPGPKAFPAPKRWPKSIPLPALELEPKVNWAGGIRQAWSPGEASARKELRHFIRSSLPDYEHGRDQPERSGTSRLSPHLHFGEISPRQIHQALTQTGPLGKQRARKPSGPAQGFLRQLYWREFAHYLLYHFPQTPCQPLRAEFSQFPWTQNSAWLTAWKAGRTGYPIVDAGMRELWTTGWMHNRVRMIAASFLVKDLLVPWQEGSRWFWDTLVDADLANNTLGWQWTAGCGADAAPYFRVFNPVLQGERFDPAGHYVRQWIPSLHRMPPQWIHRPWDAPTAILQAAGVVLGQNYPLPIVHHGLARDIALDTYRRFKSRIKGHAST